MSRENSIIKIFIELENEYQCILLSNAYDLLKEQECAKTKAEKIKKGSKLFEILEKLENIKVVK